MMTAPRGMIMFLFALLFACNAPIPEDNPKRDDAPVLEDGVVDLVQPLPVADDQHIVIASPIYEIPPYTEEMKCFAGTWKEKDIGVRWVRPYQSEFGHHAQLNQMDDTANQPEDGEFWDCDSQQVGGQLLLQSTRAMVDGQIVGELPEGMALYLPEGQRWILQSHYTNTSADTIRVQDAYEIEVIPAAEVTEWAASWLIGVDEVSVPPGPSSIRFECAWPQDFSLLSIWGHMHEWGASFKTERLVGDDWETLYELPSWDPSWTNQPRPVYYDADEMPLSKGDRFAVTCNWNNTTNGVLEFPREMCSVLGVGHGTKTPINCTVRNSETEED